MREIKLFEGMRIPIGDTEFRFSFNYSLSYPEVDEKQQTLYHDHSYIELHIVSEGILHIVVDKDYFVKKNELLMVCPGVYHNTETSKVKTERYAVGIELLKKNDEKEKTFDYFTKLLLQSGCIKLNHIQNIIRILLEMRKVLDSNKVFMWQRIKNLLISLLFYLCDRLEEKTPKTEQKLLGVEEVDWDSEDRVCLALDKIISLNAKNGFKTLDEISHELYLDKQQINRIMKKRYNTTFKKKQIICRIEYAKKILCKSEKSIDTVAYEIGYTNLTSFYKNFKQLVGCTPNEYREQVKNNDKK